MALSSTSPQKMDGSGFLRRPLPFVLMAVSRILSSARFRGRRDDHLSCPGLATGTACEGCDYYPEGLACASRAGNPSSCSVLHRMGFVVRRRLLAGRWALTPPFHPDPAGVKVNNGRKRVSPRPPIDFPFPSAGRFVFCDTFRRAGLSTRTPPLSGGMPPCGVRTFLSGRLAGPQRSSAIKGHHTAQPGRFKRDDSGVGKLLESAMMKSSL